MKKTVVYVTMGKEVEDRWLLKVHGFELQHPLDPTIPIVLHKEIVDGKPTRKDSWVITDKMTGGRLGPAYKTKEEALAGVDVSLRKRTVEKYREMQSKYGKVEATALRRLYDPKKEEE